MRDRYIIVDDFYSDPDELVQMALNELKEEDSPDGPYAGVMTTKPYLGPAMREVFQKLTLEASINSSTNSNGRLRFTRAGDPYRINIHYDLDLQTKWAGVVYLSKDHPQVEGTNFWKHKRTGLEVAPNTVEGFAEYGWKDSEDVRKFLESEGTDESLWEKTLTIPYKYNRLVLFRPWLMHSPGPAFGDTLESSRIVQTIFLGN